jgi:hypothetical protein
MNGTTIGSRFAVAALSLCLPLLVATATPSSANYVEIKDPGEVGGPIGPSQGCNQATTTGSATGGSAQNTSTGSQFDLSYAVPNDGTMYSGMLMTQVVNADGSVTINSWPISSYGNGNSGFASAYNDSMIPIGGTGSISFSQTNSAGASFSAGYVIRNFRP